MLLSFQSESFAQATYRLEIVCTNKGSVPWPESLSQKESFPDADSCKRFLVSTLLPTLLREGYLEVSIDSMDVARNLTKAWLHLGDKYQWGSLKTDSTLMQWISEKDGENWIQPGKVLNAATLFDARERALILLEENGYPFAAVRLDSSFFLENALHGRLRVERGPLYHIDSILVEGKIRIKRNFLHRYLSIPPGDIYRKSRLEAISQRLSLLGYLKEARPWQLDLLGTGSTLKLQLEQQRSSRFNLLAGLMPANQQIGGKALLTGEAEIDLKNSFGGGEELSVLWQQIQVKSPRLQLAFRKPYLFNSQLGLDFKFDLLRKDSSFLNLQSRLGIQYMRDPGNLVKIFYQQNNSSLIEVDTNLIKRSRKLPGFLDIRTSNIGMEWQWNRTDYFFNPRKGFEVNLVFSGGLRKIIPNSNILQLQSDQLGRPFSFASLYDTLRLNTAQFRLTTRLNKFTKLGRQATLRTGFQGGWLEGDRLLPNELFQLGGIKTLRGFDEEIFYASRYWIGTLEYRYLIANSSYLFSFIDYGRITRPVSGMLTGGNYAGIGFGISLETKAGQFNLAYAAGKNRDLPFNFRESKLHFGFVSLF
jgi:outer membrane protein assembly factor BamA